MPIIFGAVIIILLINLVYYLIRQAKRKAKGEAAFQPDKAPRKKVDTIITQQSAADELIKWKDLADSGVISAEEFEAKKRELLGQFPT